MNTHMKRICIFCLLLSLLCGCGTTKHISAFSKKQVEMGITQQEFINKYGKPYNQEVSYSDNITTKKLLYKEGLYIKDWYIITTAFYFENDKLVKQEVVKEERRFQNCNCKTTE